MRFGSSASDRLCGRFRSRTAQRRHLERSASAGETVPWRFGVQFRPTWPSDAQCPSRRRRGAPCGRRRTYSRRGSGCVAVVVRRVLLRAQGRAMFQRAVGDLERRLLDVGQRRRGKLPSRAHRRASRGLDACPPASRTRVRASRSRRVAPARIFLGQAAKDAEHALGSPMSSRALSLVKPAFCSACRRVSRGELRGSSSFVSPPITVSSRRPVASVVTTSRFFVTTIVAVPARFRSRAPARGPAGREVLAVPVLAWPPPARAPGVMALSLPPTHEPSLPRATTTLAPAPARGRAATRA